MNKKNILILYYSASGGTKILTDLFEESLMTNYNVHKLAITKAFDYRLMQDKELIIFAFPTYHCEPPKLVREFISHMPAFKSIQRAFAFATCGMYAANTLRIFAKACKQKNIAFIHTRVYRAPATDGTLIMPNIKCFLGFGKKTIYFIKEDLNIIQDFLSIGLYKELMPRFKWYSILNYPNKWLGKRFKFEIKLDTKKCNGCGKCSQQCPRECITVKSDQLVLDKKQCESCFRCIHHCPKGALFILKDKTFRLNTLYYQKLKQDLKVLIKF